MVCSCHKSKEKVVTLKKPSRPPPPPPPPPKKFSWPAQPHSTSSLRGLDYYAAHSDAYSEGVPSVRSIPNSVCSLPPWIPVCHHCSARSESEYHSLGSDLCSQSVSVCSYPVTHNHHCGPHHIQRPVETTPPVPRERVFRPCLSTSPMPMLKKNSDQGRPRYICKSLHYRRHMEQHVERVFKYLRDRKKRLEGYELDILEKKLKPQDEMHIRSVVAMKESSYLRSLRKRLTPKDFEEIKRLGSGFMGNVMLVKKISQNGTETTSSSLYAMKKLRKSQVFQQNHMAHVMAERDILAEANNEWIVKLYHSFQDDLYLYFILEYVAGGDMMNLLSVQSVFPEEWASFYISEISLALQFVHDMKFIHRDIKPDNILIDKQGHIKLADFGLCTGFRWTHDLDYYREDTLNCKMNPSGNGNNIHEDHPTITKALTQREIEHSRKKRALSLVGSPNYIAPEVLRQESTNERLCDWWSVGVILYEMVIGYCPFIDLQKLKARQYDPRCDPPEYIQSRILNWRDNLAFPSPNDPNSPPLMFSEVTRKKSYISNEAKSLIQGWLCEPDKRLCQNGILDIKDHPFFRGIDWQNIRKMKAPYIPHLDNELDTRHFDQFLQCEPDGTVGTSIGSRMRVNDFTYHTFWNRSLGD